MTKQEAMDKASAEGGTYVEERGGNWKHIPAEGVPKKVKKWEREGE